jgi:hypothetical protein
MPGPPMGERPERKLNWASALPPTPWQTDAFHSAAEKPASVTSRPGAEIASSNHLPKVTQTQNSMLVAAATGQALCVW